MIKLCSDIFHIILKKYPDAELFVNNGHVFQSSELTIICQNHLFVTLTPFSHKVSVVVYGIIRSVNKKNQGFLYINEYLVSRQQKDGKHMTSYFDLRDGCRLVKIRCALSELIDYLELDVSKPSQAKSKDAVKRP